MKKFFSPSTFAALLAVSVVVLLAASAYAVPAPQLLAPRPIDSGGTRALTGGGTSDLIVGGGSGFGTSITPSSLISAPVRIGGDGGNRIDSYRRARHHQIHSVPEPGTTWLMGAGLLGLLLVSRRTVRASR